MPFYRLLSQKIRTPAANTIQKREKCGVAGGNNGISSFLSQLP